MDKIQILTRRLKREKAARFEAEAILESKSLELHESKIAVENALRELRSKNVESRPLWTVLPKES